MNLKTLTTKTEVRKAVVKRRKEISPSEIRNKTNLIVDRLASTDDFAFSNKVHTYVSTKAGEVDTRFLIDYMIRTGKSVILPKLVKQTKKFLRGDFNGWDNLIKNPDGYYEPVSAVDADLSDIDLIIVPAMAVSIVGQRVDHGGGFYDRLLKQTNAKKIVLAFEFQVFDNIEKDSHDIRIDKIITERRVINTRRPGE